MRPKLIDCLADPTCLTFCISASEFEKCRAELSATASGMRLKIVELDCSRLEGTDDIWNHFALAFDFPGWFGRNWDALSDLLRDLSWFDRQGYVVLFVHEESLATLDADVVRKLALVLRRVITHWQSGESETGLLPHPVTFRVVGISSNGQHPLMSQLPGAPR